MRDAVILFIHLIATVTRFLGPGGIRSVVAESLLLKHQQSTVQINRGLYTSCMLYMRDGRLLGANNHRHLLKLEDNVTHGDGPGESTRRGADSPPP